MTTREHLNHLRRRTIWLWLAVIVLAVVAYCNHSTFPIEVSLVAVFGIVIIGIITTLIEKASGHCLHCRQDILRHVARSDWLPRGIPAAVRFCPRCGVSLDLPAPEIAPPPSTPAADPRA